MAIKPVIGQPGIQTGSTVTYGNVFKQPEEVKYLPGGGTILSTSQDAQNTANPLTLRAGLPMGKQASTGEYAPSWLGTLSNPLGGAQTSFTTTATTAAEIVRRIGTSGTLALIGPPTPGGLAREFASVAFSAVNTSTGVVTITATAIGTGGGTNAVYPLTVVDSTGSGTFTLSIEGILTAAITYSATAATLVTNINTALNATFGTSAIVASGASLAAIILTFSGTGYTHRPIGPVVFDILTGSTGYTINGVGTLNTPTAVTATTPGVLPVTADEGEFIAGSFIGVGDGTEVPITVIPDGSGITMVGSGTPVDFYQVPYSAMIRVNGFIGWPTDTGLQTWVMQQMNGTGLGQWNFDSAYPKPWGSS